MKKRILASVLAIGMVAALVACGGSKTEEAAQAAEETVEEAAEEVEETAEAAEETVEEVAEAAEEQVEEATEAAEEAVEEAAPADGELSSEWSGLPKKAGLPDYGLDKDAVAAAGYTIGFSQCVMDHPYRLNMVKLAKEWCDEWKVNYIEMDGEGDPAQEVSNIESLISQQVDAIVISSHAGVAITPALAEAAEAGIPVVLLDGGKPFDDWTYACWMSTDDYEMAMMACDLMVAETGGEGKIVELQGVAGSSCTIGRNAAITDTVNNNNYELVFSQDCNWLRDEAIEATSAQLQAHPDLKAVIAHNDEMALGAIEAIKAAGKVPGQDVLVYSCGDYQENAFEAIKAGELQCTQIYSERGNWACETAVAVLEGKEVPHLINLGTEQATAENVDTRTFAY